MRPAGSARRLAGRGGWVERARAHTGQARRRIVAKRTIAQPVDVAQGEDVDGEVRAGTDHDLVAGGIEADHEQRLGGGDPEAAALADREMHDAVVTAEHAAIDVHDIAGLDGAGPQLLDHVGIAAAGHEADVLAVRLRRHRQRQRRRLPPDLGLGKRAQGKPQPLELSPRRREQEIALVAVGIGGAVQAGAVRAVAPLRRSGRSPGCRRRGSSAVSSRSRNLICWLQATHGIGVSPSR